MPFKKQKITRVKMEYLAQQVVEEIDYDIAKNFDPETAEEGPEAGQELLDDFVEFLAEKFNLEIQG